MTAPHQQTTRDAVIALVTGETGVGECEIFSSSRAAKPVMARHLAIWLLQRVTGCAPTVVGRIFGRDSSSVRHAILCVITWDGERAALRDKLEAQARQVVGDRLGASDSRYGVALSIVCRLFAVRRDDVLSKQQGRATMVPARQLAMWLMRQQTGASLPVIGRLFDRDHTTVYLAVKRVDAWTGERARLRNQARTAFLDSLRDTSSALGQLEPMATAERQPSASRAELDGIAKAAAEARREGRERAEAFDRAVRRTHLRLQHPTARRPVAIEKPDGWPEWDAPQ